MNHYYVGERKEEWEDEELQRDGYSSAYARARYAVRFMTIADALVYLEEHLESWHEYLHRHPIRETDQNDRKSMPAYFERLRLIMDQMRQLL